VKVTSYLKGHIFLLHPSTHIFFFLLHIELLPNPREKEKQDDEDEEKKEEKL
jgi:hypothetical protein